MVWLLPAADPACYTLGTNERSGDRQLGIKPAVKHVTHEYGGPTGPDSPHQPWARLLIWSGAVNALYTHEPSRAEVECAATSRSSSERRLGSASELTGICLSARTTRRTACRSRGRGMDWLAVTEFTTC